MSAYYVYIMSNRTHRLYIGVTNDLMRRVDEHKRRVARGFTNKDYLNTLVYFEEAANPASAIAREKQLKGWLRARKLALIEAANPRWTDVSRGWFGADGASLRGDPSLRSG